MSAVKSRLRLPSSKLHLRRKYEDAQLIDFAPSIQLSLCHGKHAIKYLLPAHHHEDLFNRIPKTNEKKMSAEPATWRGTPGNMKNPMTLRWEATRKPTIR